MNPLELFYGVQHRRLTLFSEIGEKLIIMRAVSLQTISAEDRLGKPLVSSLSYLARGAGCTKEAAFGSSLG
jgi:hypothetical protein